MKSNIFSNSFLTLFLVFISTEICSGQSMTPKEFNSINPENIVWKSFSAFPEKIKLAILVGDPNKREPFIVRVKVPSGETSRR